MYEITPLNNSIVNEMEKELLSKPVAHGPSRKAHGAVWELGTL